MNSISSGGRSDQSIEFDMGFDGIGVNWIEVEG